MTSDRANDARAFQDFLKEKLAQGGVESLDEVLSLWDRENFTEVEKDHVLDALRQGFEDVEAGRVMPAREALAELRKKHHLSEFK